MEATLNLGAKIRNLRELKNYTQSFMAEQLNVSQKTYSNMENESTKISIDVLQSISKILEIPLEKLLDFDVKSIFSAQNCQTGNIGVVVNQVEKEFYEKLITQHKSEIEHLKSEIAYLRDLLSKHL